MIIFTDVQKNYGGKIILDQINLKIEGQEFVSITGPSGVGKSTLINLIIGGEKPEKGSISVDGYEINKLSPSSLQFFRRKIGIVFQDYKLLRNKTVYENVAFAMEVCGESDKKIRERVPRLLELVGLSDKRKSYPHHLSGGESQRVALARALVHNPRLVIADEPTGNLDQENAHSIIKLLLKLNEQAGVTIILATHDREIVNIINKRVVRLGQGRILADVNKSGYHIDDLVLTQETNLIIENKISSTIHIGESFKS